MLPSISGEFGVVFEPEIKFNDKGNAWVKIRGAASDRIYNPETKEWEQRGDTVFLDIILGGKLAEHLTDSITIGDTIAVSGELVQKEWTTAEGDKRVSYQIRAKTVGVGLIGGPAKTRRYIEQHGTASKATGDSGSADSPWGDQSTAAPF